MEEEEQDQSINYVLVFIMLFAVALACGVLSFLTVVVTGILSLSLGSG